MSLLKIGNRTLKLQTTITLMVCCVLAVVLFTVYFMFSTKISNITTENLEQKAVTIARTVSKAPTVISALSGKESITAVQPFAEEVRKLNDVQFVVVMNAEGIRLSHPDPSLIGQHFAGGDEGEALHGKEFISIAQGTLGTSVRAFSPIYSEGELLGVVAVGLPIDTVKLAVKQNRWILYLGMLAGATLGGLGAVLLARRLKRLMFGMEPQEISRFLEERSAMLQSAKEGIVAVDTSGKVTLINAAAKRLLKISGIDEDNQTDLYSMLHLDKVLASGKALNDIAIDQEEITLLVNIVPVKVHGAIEGAIATFRDKTEIDVLMERLSGVSLYAEALRAQTHEFMNKLHVLVGLNHMRKYDRLDQYLSDILEHFQSEAGMLVKQVKDPVMAGFLLGKLSRARETGAQITILEEGVLLECADPETSHELVTIVGNLLENALEAPNDAESKEVSLGFRYEDQVMTVTVRDNGKGISEETMKQMYEQGFSTKGKNRGIGLYLIMRSVKKLGGELSCHSEPNQGTEFIVRIPYQLKLGEK